jgi:hydrophobic/amphiphilic exporter-1 (mainly G- bacteria), HAE1 family
MALALDEGGELQAPMGRAIIGGVITSTLLTLIVVPVMYSYLDGLAAWAKRRFGAKHEPVGGGAIPEQMPASKE